MGTYVAARISPEPTVLGATWRYRWLVLACVGGAVGLALLYGLARPRQYAAKVSLLVQAARASASSDSASTVAQRYIADQVAIIRSADVARRAAQLTAERLPSAGLTPEDFLHDADVASHPESDLVTITFQSRKPREAQVGADALGEAYLAVRRSNTAANSASGMKRLAADIATVDGQLTRIRTDLANAQAGGLGDQFNRQLRDATTRILALEDEQSGTTDVGRKAQIRVEVDDLVGRLQTLEAVRTASAADPDVTKLLEEQRQTMSRRDNLASRRDAIAIDADLAGDDVTFFSRSQRPAAPTGTALPRLLAVAIVVGVLAGAGLAYLLARRRWTSLIEGNAAPEYVARHRHHPSS
jgi:uncharacterized protein involved in exopolysaccharide biosynthesis